MTLIDVIKKHGMSKVAKKIGVTTQAVQGWVNRNEIPPRRRIDHAVFFKKLEKLYKDL